MNRDFTPTIAERNAAIIASFTMAERILYAFSKDPVLAFRDGDGNAGGDNKWDESNALSVLRWEFADFDFDKMIRSRRVIDYGCGEGFQSTAMAKAGAAEVLGVETEDARLEPARRMAKGLTNISFTTKAPEDGGFNVAISLNSFEHFVKPAQNLQELGAAVRNGGRILIIFGPPWLAPYGSHMHFFTRCPWINTLFSEKTVFRVRSLYRNDDAKTYSPGLNRMTLRKFRQLIDESGLQLDFLRHRTIKNLALIGALPGVRELLVNQVTCVLRKV